MERKKKIVKAENNTNDTQHECCIKTLKVLIKDPALLKQRKTFEEIQKVLEKSNDNWKKLNTKCQRLELEIAANTSKIKAAIQLSVEDKSTIDTLKEELEKAWEIADDVRSKTTSSHLKTKSSFQEVYVKDLESKSAEKFKCSINKVDAVERQSHIRLDMQSKMIDDLKAEKGQLKQNLMDKDALLQEKTDMIKQMESNLKRLEELNLNQKPVSEDHHNLVAELENNRLHLFELEEEVAHKEKNIEELEVENKIKARALQEMEVEISALKAKQNSQGESDHVLHKTLSKATMTDCKSYSQRDELQNLETQFNSMATKDIAIRAKLKEMEVKFKEKTSLLIECKRKNKMLRVELREKTEKFKALVTQCDLLKDELYKSTTAIKELENIRDKNVCSMGRLEVKTLELKKELVEFKHNKYPEAIQSLSKEFQDLRAEMVKEREGMRKNKIAWEVAVVEKNELKEFVAKIKKQMRVALQLLDSFKNQSDTKSMFQADACASSTTMADPESAGDLLSHFKSLIDYLVELCKELMAENHQLSAEIECSKASRNTNLDELGIHEKIEGGCSEANKVSIATTGSSVNDHDVHLYASEDIESVSNHEKSKDADMENETPAKFELLTKSFNAEMEDRGSRYNSIHSLLIHSEESNNVGKIDNQQPMEDHKSRCSKLQTDFPPKHLPRKSEFFGSPEWMKYGNQLKMKTKKLQLMEANFESFNSDFSTHNTIYSKNRLRQKNCSPISVQQLSLEQFRKNLNK